MPRSSNFTDAQKAELFVRDRATCVYSGTPLWVLDYGASAMFHIDWADHILPVARGGKSTLANGVCAWSEVNYWKGAKIETHRPWFRRGEPTAAYLKDHGVVSRSMRRQLKTFSQLHESDWFFNRALFRLMLGVRFLAEKDCPRTRDDLYYARAALKMRTEWERRSRTGVASLEDRGLVPAELRADQRIMLAIRNETTVDGIQRRMRRLVPAWRRTLRELEGTS